MRETTWLDRELQRLWLVAELGLRHLVEGKARPVPSGDLRAVLAARAESRGDANDLSSLSARVDRVEREVAEARGASPLGRLAARLALSHLETEVLIIALAPHIDPALAELFQALRGGPKRGVTLTFVTQLLRLTRADRTRLLGVLDPERPLLQWRLIEVGNDPGDGTAGGRVVHPSLGAIDLLSVEGEPSSALRRFAKLVHASKELDDLVLAPELRTAVTRLCHGTGAAPWTVLWGLTGAGKRTIAGRIAAHRGQPLLALDLMSAEAAQRKTLLRIAQRDALVLGATLYLGPLPPSGDDVRDLLRPLAAHEGHVILGIETARPRGLSLEVAVRVLELAVPDESTRLALWKQQLPNAKAESGVEAIARAFHLTPGEIASTAREALLVAHAEKRPPTVSDLRTGVERRLRNGLQDLAWQVDVRVEWSDLVLAPDDRGRVEEFIARRVFAPKVYGEWGFGRRVERGRGSIALFSGPPGTGKTMLAGLIAKGLGLDLYQVDLSQIQSRYVGETEKSLGKVFDLAERAHAVLLFDEADSLLSKRTDVETSNDRYANAHVNYLLQRLEAYSGVVVMTTNKDAALDDALQRRLTLHLRLDVPEVPERERLWQSFLPPALPREPIDISALATEFELTGGYIKNVVVRAAFLAAREQRHVSTSLLRRAAVLEMEDMGRVVHLQSRAA